MRFKTAEEKETGGLFSAPHCAFERPGVLKWLCCIGLAAICCYSTHRFDDARSCDMLLKCDYSN